MRIVVERAPWAAAVLACACMVPALCGCFLAGLSECPPEPQDFDAGTEVDGLSTDQILAPLIGDHVGTLTWLQTGRTTTLRLHVARAGGIANYDCGHAFDGFELHVNGRVATDDGVIASMPDGGVPDPTLAGAQFTTDPAGRLYSEPTFRWRLDFAPLLSAGVVDPSLMESNAPEVNLSVTTMHLKPVDSVIQVEPSALVAPVSVAMIHFSS
jgi:hypothetical protein